MPSFISAEQLSISFSMVSHKSIILSDIIILIKRAVFKKAFLRASGESCGRV